MENDSKEIMSRILWLVVIIWLAVLLVIGALGVNLVVTVVGR